MHTKTEMKYYISYSYHEHSLDTWNKNLVAYIKLQSEFGEENVICPIFDKHNYMHGYTVDPLEIGVYMSNENYDIKSYLEIIDRHRSEPKMVCIACGLSWTKTINYKIKRYDSIWNISKYRPDSSVTKCCDCGGIMEYELFIFDRGITIIMHKSAWNIENDTWNSEKCQKEYEYAIKNRIRVLDIDAFLDKKIIDFAKGRRIHD